MTRISNRQVVENSQSEITRSSNRPIKSRAVHQRRFLFCYSSLPLQGSFDGDSFFSASAPRLASPFLPSSLLFLYQLLFQVKYDVFLHWLTSLRGSFLSFVREQLVVIHYMDVVRQRWNTRPLTEVSLMFLFLVLVWSYIYLDWHYFEERKKLLGQSNTLRATTFTFLNYDISRWPERQLRWTTRTILLRPILLKCQVVTKISSR